VSRRGAGATCALLGEGHRRTEQGADVVVAGVQTGGRPFTAGMLEGLEIIPPATAAFTGAAAGDMDLGAVLARTPQVALVDDLAHSNLPGRGYASRWQDVAELMAAGIDVITTVSIGNLDSLVDVAENITGVPAGKTVPDPVVRAADEIELVDVTPEAPGTRIRSRVIRASSGTDVHIIGYPASLHRVADSTGPDRTGHASDHVPGKGLPAGGIVKPASVRY
jgi:two-component system sensor histidine kinase KdpD